MKWVGQPGRDHSDPICCIIQRHSPYSTWRLCSCQNCTTPSCQSHDTTVEQDSQSKLQPRHVRMQIKSIWSVLLRGFEFELVDPFPEPDFESMVVGPKPCRVHYKRRKQPL